MVNIWIIKFLLIFLISSVVKSAPNIVFVLFDDVGWADFNYNVDGHSAIPTPNLDALAAKGKIVLVFFFEPQQIYSGK